MELTVNHKKKTFEHLPASLEVLVQSEAPGIAKGIAVALNNQVIPKEQWGTTVLRDRDTILIITATQGG